MSGIRSITRRPTEVGAPADASAPIYVDSDDNILKYLGGGAGSTTETQVPGVGGNTTSSVTNASATPGVVNGLSVAMSTSVSVTAGTLDAIRGLFTLPGGDTLSGSTFAYGVTGRNVINGTVNIGAGDLAAVFAKADYNGATLTSGHIAPLQANIVNPPADSSKLNLVYLESGGGAVLNSVIQAIANATYALDFSEVGIGHFIITAAVGGSNTTKLKVNMNGTTFFIPLYTA